MRHEAIYATHPNVVSIDDTAGAFDADGNAVAIDESLVEAEVARLIAEQPAKEARAKRDRLLTESDWVTIRATDTLTGLLRLTPALPLRQLRVVVRLVGFITRRVVTHRLTQQATGTTTRAATLRLRLTSTVFTILSGVRLLPIPVGLRLSTRAFGAEFT